MSIHRTILKQSWKNFWQKKYLWFFGIFASFFCGISSFEISYNLFFGQNELQQIKSLFNTGIFTLNFYINFFKLFIEKPLQVILVLFIVFFAIALFFFIIWLSVISKGAIIKNTASVKLEEQNNFKIGIETGIRNFWPIFSFSLIIKIFTFVSFILLSWDLILNEGRNILTNLLYSVIFVFITSFLIILSFVVEYSMNYVIIKKYNFINSLTNAFSLFKKNWLITLEMGFLLYFINIFVALVYILTITIAIVPLLLSAFILIKAGSMILFSIMITLAILLFFLISIVLISFITSFQTGANSILFIELLTKGGTSKIMRIFNKN